MKRFIFASALIAASLLAFSCAKDPVLVESVSIAPKSQTLTIGETLPLNVTVLPDNADDKTVTWASSKPEVATVSDAGVVTAVASGQTVISATSADGMIKDECTITVTLKDALYSFSSRKYMMSASASVEVNLVNKDGSAYVAEEKIVIPVKVSSKSTAVEGTNFKFNNKPEVVIEVGKGKGTVVLDFLKQEAGKDIIVLGFDIPSDASYLQAGQYIDTQITIFGSYADQIKGTWVMNAIETDAEFMFNTWWGMLTMDGFPTFNPGDKMTFGDNGLETEFKSEFKYFFKEQSDVTLGEEMLLHANVTSWQDQRTVQLLKLSNVNRYFCPDQTSEDTEAYIGVRINDEGLLEVFLIDVEYKGFFSEIVEWGLNPEKPVIGDSSGSYIIFNMKRAE